MLKRTRPRPGSAEAEDLGRQPGLEPGDRLFLVGRRVAELAPGLGELPGQSRDRPGCGSAGPGRRRGRLGGSSRRPSGRARPSRTRPERPACRSRPAARRGGTTGSSSPGSCRSPGRRTGPDLGPRSALRNRTLSSFSQIDRRSGGRSSIRLRSAASRVSRSALSSRASLFISSSARPSPKRTPRSRTRPRDRVVPRRRKGRPRATPSRAAWGPSASPGALPRSPGGCRAGSRDRSKPRRWRAAHRPARASCRGPRPVAGR